MGKQSSAVDHDETSVRGFRERAALSERRDVGFPAPDERRLDVEFREFFAEIRLLFAFFLGAVYKSTYNCGGRLARAGLVGALPLVGQFFVGEVVHIIIPVIGAEVPDRGAPRDQVVQTSSDDRRAKQ